jgi:hypothetical protein
MARVKPARRPRGPLDSRPAFGEDFSILCTVQHGQISRVAGKRGCAAMIGDLEDKTLLYRFVDSDQAVENSIAGRLWLRTFAHFAKLEDPERRDDREGISSGQIRGGSWIDWINEKNMVSPQYILSFTECESPPRNWGHRRLRLTSIEDLKERVRESMPRCTVISWKVTYSDDLGYQRRPAGFEMWERASLTKRTIYDPEKEWRLIVVLPGLKITNRTLKIDVGVLSGILDFSPGN